MFILLVTILMLIALMETPRLAAEKMWRELLVFLGLWAFGSFLAVAQFLGLELPNPTDLISAIFSFK
jgi:hypothetical protein